MKNSGLILVCLLFCLLNGCKDSTWVHVHNGGHGTGPECITYRRDTITKVEKMDTPSPDGSPYVYYVYVNGSLVGYADKEDEWKLPKR